MATYLFSELPYAATLDPQHCSNRCWSCFIVCDSTDVPCDQECGKAIYCSQTCMETDRPWHSNECIAYRNGNLFGPDTKVRLLARLITRLNADKGAAILSTDFPSDMVKHRNFFDLMSHDRERNKDPLLRKISERLYENFTRSFRGTSLEGVRLKEIQHLNNVFKINAFSIVARFSALPADCAIIGSGVYLDSSRFNHSCRPSLIYSFDGCRLIIKKVQNSEDTKAMTKKEFESLTLNYGFGWQGYTVWLTQDRQKSLEMRYYFRCRCALCSDKRLNKLQMDASPVECQCGQPYVWYKKMWSPKMGLKKTCKCRNSKNEAAKELMRIDNVQDRLKILNEKWGKCSLDQCLDGADQFWHPKYNLRYGQLNERLMRVFTKQIQTRHLAMESGEKMLESYLHNSTPYDAAMASLMLVLGAMYLMEEGNKIPNRKRASELCLMAANVWRQYGDPKRVQELRRVNETIQKEIKVLTSDQSSEEMEF